MKADARLQAGKMVEDMLFTGPAAIARRDRRPIALIAAAGVSLRAALDSEGWDDMLTGELFRATARRDYDDRVEEAMRVAESGG